MLCKDLKEIQARKHGINLVYHDIFRFLFPKLLKESVYREDVSIFYWLIYFIYLFIWLIDFFFLKGEGVSFPVVIYLFKKTNTKGNDC